MYGVVVQYLIVVLVESSSESYAGGITKVQLVLLPDIVYGKLWATYPLFLGGRLKKFRTVIHSV
jgi:hypothetical protein